MGIFRNRKVKKQMRNRLLYVFNAHAGKGTPAFRTIEVIERLTEMGYLVTAYPTQKDMDYRQLFADFGQGKIICSGGDGMMNAVVNALLPAVQSRPFGYLPAGTTNDFARSIGISRDGTEALEGAVEGKVRLLDAGCMNGRYFVYIAAFGAFTNISYVTPQGNKNMFGYLAYVMQGIREISELKTTYAKVTLDAGTEEERVIENEFVVGMVTNSASVAGFKSIGRFDYFCDDGVFEVVLLKKPSRFSELQQVISALYEGRADGNCMIYAQSAHIRIESEEEIAYTLDGEYGGSFQKAEIQNLHKCLSIRV